jgi:hypothetical protein
VPYRRSLHTQYERTGAVAPATGEKGRRREEPGRWA